MRISIRTKAISFPICPKAAEGGKDFSEWYVEEKERIKKDIEFYKEKIQQDRKMVDAYIESASYPECDIIRYRVINGLGWYDIGELIGYSRTQSMRKFYKYIKCTQCTS